ncbi:MAG: PilZ domain-containing protein [Polyangiaceae bacterium]
MSSDSDGNDEEHLPDAEPKARRVHGVRTPVSEAVVFRNEEREVEGWSLNMSRGGLRAILDEMVSVGDEFDVTVGEDAEPRLGRIVWVRQEKGGAIVGLAFLDAEGSVPPPPGTDPGGLIP